MMEEEKARRAGAGAGAELQRIGPAVVVTVAKLAKRVPADRRVVLDDDRSVRYHPPVASWTLGREAAQLYEVRGGIARLRPEGGSEPAQALERSQLKAPRGRELDLQWQAVVVSEHRGHRDAAMQIGKEFFR